MADSEIDPLSRFDVHNTSFLTDKKYTLKWTLKNFSKLLEKGNILSSDLKPLPTYEWNLTLTSEQSEKELYLFMLNQSQRMITLEYNVSMYDCHGTKWYEESDECTLARDQKADIMGDVSDLMSKLRNLSNDTLTLIVSFKIIGVVTTVKSDFTKTESLPEYNGRKRLWIDLRNLYKTKQHTDVILSADGRKLSAHKAILCARSPVFEKMFHHKMDEEERNSVEIDDVKLPTLQKLVDFLYCGTVEADEEDIDMVYALYYAADKYEVLDLRKMCSRTLLSKMTQDNATRILVWADQHQDQELKSETKDFIQSNFEAVVETDTWDEFVSTEINLAAETMKFCAKRVFIKTGDLSTYS